MPLEPVPILMPLVHYLKNNKQETMKKSPGRQELQKTTKKKLQKIFFANTSQTYRTSEVIEPKPPPLRLGRGPAEGTAGGKHIKI